MSELKSIEKLRDRDFKPGYHGEPTLEMIADEIQAEIDSRYMLLPVDRKGETWRIGDTFTFGDDGGKLHTCTVSGIGDGELFFYYDEHASSSKHRHFNASKLQHSKPRTVEDVLRDALNMHYEGACTLDVIDKYADELRMAGGDAE